MLVDSTTPFVVSARRQSSVVFRPSDSDLGTPNSIVLVVVDVVVYLHPDTFFGSFDSILDDLPRELLYAPGSIFDSTPNF